MNNASYTSRAGFTLIEVVIALAILGTGMLVLLESHFGSLLLFDEAQDTTVVELLTKQGSALVEIEILSGSTNGSGDFGDAYPEYSWEYTATIVDDFELPGLLDVEFSLITPNDKEPKEFLFRVYDGAMEYDE